MAPSQQSHTVESAADRQTYEIIVGTDIHEDEQLAIAQAVNQIRELWIEEIVRVDTYGGDDQQIGVGLTIITVEPADVIERHAETVEEVA